MEDPATVSTPSELPAFARQWMQQWKEAAPQLQAMRDEELRESGGRLGAAGLRLLGAAAEGAGERGSGLVIQQAWFMRARMLQLEEMAAGNRHDGAGRDALR